MKLLKELNAQTEHKRQVQVAKDAIVNGVFSNALALQRKNVDVDPEVKNLTDQVFDECSFLK